MIYAFLNLSLIVLMQIAFCHVDNIIKTFPLVLFLGFLSTMDENSPGNYGLMDILAALRFLEKYIADFGGNPNNITLGGFGSGASAAALLTLSPKSKISTCEFYICDILYQISDFCDTEEWGPISYR